MTLIAIAKMSVVMVYAAWFAAVAIAYRADRRRKRKELYGCAINHGTSLETLLFEAV